MKRAGVVFFVLAGCLGLVVSVAPVRAQTLSQRLAGKILLQVESKGEAWYVEPSSLQRYYLGRPDDAFRVMRELGLGIADADLALIPESGSTSTGNSALRTRLKGKILLQVEAHGEAWYVNPDDLKRYYLGRPADAFALMRKLGLGISDENLLSIPVSLQSAPVEGTHADAPGLQTPAQVSDGLNDGRGEIRFALLAKINEERSSKGVAPYALENHLSQAAQLQADDMTVQHYTGTTSPSGKTISDWIKQTGYDAASISENIAQTNAGADGLVTVWKTQSPSSYNNAVSTEYEHIGVGVGRVDGLDVYTVLFAQSFATFFADKTVGLTDAQAVRDEMLQRVNAARAAEGVAPLAMNALLQEAAQAHAQDMFDRAYYSHESPEGTNAFDRVTAHGYKSMLAAENIAKNQFSVAQVMESWLNSPEHRDNIMDPDLKEVGFGLAYGKNTNGYELLWVQDFGAPMP